MGITDTEYAGAVREIVLADGQSFVVTDRTGQVLFRVRPDQPTEHKGIAFPDGTTQESVSDLPIVGLGGSVPGDSIRMTVPYSPAAGLFQVTVSRTLVVEAGTLLAFISAFASSLPKPLVPTVVVLRINITNMEGTSTLASSIVLASYDEAQSAPEWQPDFVENPPTITGTDLSVTANTIDSFGGDTYAVYLTLQISAD